MNATTVSKKASKFTTLQLPYFVAGHAPAVLIGCGRHFLLHCDPTGYLLYLVLLTSSEWHVGDGTTSMFHPELLSICLPHHNLREGDLKKKIHPPDGNSRSAKKDKCLANKPRQMSWLCKISCASISQLCVCVCPGCEG